MKIIIILPSLENDTFNSRDFLDQERNKKGHQMNFANIANTICLLLYLLTGIFLKKLKIFLIYIYNNFELSNQQYI